MNNLLLFIICFVLFIVLVPGIIVKPPKVYKEFFIFGHCLLFTAVYIYLRTAFSAKTIEGLQGLEKFTEEEINRCKLIDEKFNESLDKNQKSTSLKYSQEEFDLKIKELVPDVSDDEIIKYKEYQIMVDELPENDFKFDETTEEGKKHHTDEPYWNKLKDPFEKKITAIFDDASVEKIQFISSLDENEINALENVAKKLSIEELRKIIELDDDKIKKMISELMNEKQ